MMRSFKDERFLLYSEAIQSDAVNDAAKPGFVFWFMARLTNKPANCEACFSSHFYQLFVTRLKRFTFTMLLWRKIWLVFHVTIFEQHGSFIEQTVGL